MYVCRWLDFRMYERTGKRVPVLLPTFSRTVVYIYLYLFFPRQQVSHTRQAKKYFTKNNNLMCIITDNLSHIHTYKLYIYIYTPVITHYISKNNYENSNKQFITFLSFHCLRQVLEGQKSGMVCQEKLKALLHEVAQEVLLLSLLLVVVLLPFIFW